MNFEPFPARVTRVVRETSEAISIYFEDLPRLANYKPGQFVTLEMEPGATVERRSYSLCTAPGLDAEPGICVKAVVGGLVSNYLLETVRAGMTLTLLPPIGNFVYTPEPAATRHIILIAAGSGITPLFSMLKAAIAQEPNSFISLIYANRREGSAIFLEQLRVLAAQHSARFQLCEVYSQPNTVWGGATGRLSADMLTELLYHLKPLATVQKSLAYLCGPQAMMDALEPALKTEGVAKADIHRESFFSDALAAYQLVHSLDTPAGPYNVEIRLDGKVHKVDVPSTETILEAALKAGIHMPYSCQSGLCTACMGRCLAGAVEMAEMDGLSDAEVDEGYVLTCVGYAKAPNTIIEIA